MGQTLTNGIYLPAEGERNCYEGLAANWTALDGLIGGYNAHVGNATIHVTAADKEAWNGKADASALTAHTGDTTIHVTSADKQAWNGHVADTVKHVTASDKTTWNGHVADTVKHVTASDKTTWNTVTSKANDSDVVHKSGNETVTGTKTIKGVDLKFESSIGEYGVTGGSASLNFYDKNSLLLSCIKQGMYTSGISYNKFSISAYDSNNNQIERNITLSSSSNSLATIYLRSDLDNIAYLGTSGNRWARVYATNYYYGNDNVEFSNKFVTTDTNQTISGVKTFNRDLIIANTDTTANTPNLTLRNYKADRGTTDTGVQTISFLDKNAKALTVIESRRTSNGSTGTNILTYNTDDSNNTVSGGVSIIKSKTSTNFAPNTDNAVTCGRPLAKWSDVQTYKVNTLEPSSLSLPSGNLNDIIDISSYLTYLDGSNANTYIAPANGWISITMSNSSGIQAYINGLWGHQVVRPSVGGIRFFMPILKDKTANILIFGGTIDNARFIPCQGNV